MANMNNRNRRGYMNNRNIRPQNMYNSRVSHEVPIQPQVPLVVNDKPNSHQEENINSSTPNNLNSNEHEHNHHENTNKNQENVNTQRQHNMNEKNNTHKNNPIGVNDNPKIKNSLNSILGIFKSKNISLDRDKLILLFLIYLLYKEDKEKDNVKLLIALAYILL